MFYIVTPCAVVDFETSVAALIIRVDRLYSLQPKLAVIRPSDDRW